MISSLICEDIVQVEASGSAGPAPLLGLHYVPSSLWLPPRGQEDKPGRATERNSTAEIIRLHKRPTKRLGLPSVTSYKNTLIDEYLFKVKHDVCLST